jgi:uncharacterized protein (TIGR02284 family)
MESISEIVGVLNDLLKINRDRVENYKKASYDTSDPGLKALFWNMADQSRKNITDITKEIIHHNGSSESSETTPATKIYDAWVDFKAKFSGSSVKNVLTACESREVEVLHAYKKAKVKPSSAPLIDLIERHEQSLRSSHEVIRVYQQAYSKIDRLFS